MDFFTKDKQARKEKKEKKEKAKKEKKERDKKEKNSKRQSINHGSHNSEPLSSESSSPNQNSRDDYFADKESQPQQHNSVSSTSSFGATSEDSTGTARSKKISITLQEAPLSPTANSNSGPKGFLEFYDQEEIERIEQELKPRTRERSKSQSLGYASGSKSVPSLQTSGEAKKSKDSKEKDGKLDRKKRATSLLKKEGSSTSLKSTEDSSGSHSGEGSSRDNSKSSYGSPPPTRNEDKLPVYQPTGSHSSPNLKKNATSRKLGKLFGNDDQASAPEKTEYPKEQEEMHTLFDIPNSESLISYFSFQKNGRLFVTANYLCVIQGFSTESKCIIPFRDVICIEKKSGKRLTIGDTVDVVTTTETHSFAGFFHNPMKVLEAAFAPWTQINQSLHHAVKRDDIAYVNALLENHAKLGVDVNKYDYEGQPAIHVAIKNSNATIVERLLDFYKKNQLDVNVVDSYGWTPLHCATFYCSGKQAEDIIVKALLETPGISIDIETVDGNLPLHYFCQKFVNPSCTDLGLLLTKKQSSVNKINKNGETPLHKAIFNNSVRMLMVELLINAGADVNVPTITGETALHYAVHLGRRDLLKTLLHAGAGKSLKAKSKKNNATPLELATSIGQDKIAEILQKASDLIEWLTEMELERFFLKFFQEELYVDTLLEYVDSEAKADMTIDSLKLDGLTMGARLTLRKGLLGLRERYNRKLLSETASDNNNAKPATSNTLDFKKKVKNARNQNKMAPNPVLVAKRMERIRSDLGVTDDASWYIKHEEIEFTKKIGSGTSGKVFKGLYKNKKVAIKVLKTEDQSVEEEFKKEFRVLSVLTSPHIVEFIGACFEPKLCMVMEFCSYGSLYHVLSNKDIKVDWDMAFKFAIEMIAGLNCLHTWNPPIFHRDMKSLNILVNEHWEVKLTDFGLARFNTADNMRTLANMVGTIGWTAPELLGGAGYTARSDIYSAAIILWEIFTRVLTGSYQQPFKEYALKDQQIMILTMEKALRPTIPATCYPDLAALIRRAWDPEPDKRPDCVEIFSKLEEIHKIYFKNPAEWIAGAWADGLTSESTSMPSTTATGATDTLGSVANTQQSVGSLDAN